MGLELARKQDGGPNEDFEKVVCVRRDTLVSDLLSAELLPVSEDTLDTAFRNATFRALKREKVETNERWRQLVTYQVIAAEGRLLCYKRSRSQGDPRLRSLRSVGFGGHVSPADRTYDGGRRLNLAQTVMNAARREMNEEIKCATDSPFIRGIINDTSNAVGRVHLGFLLTSNIFGTGFTIIDPSVREAEFEPLKHLEERQEEFEPWSQIAIQAISKLWSFPLTRQVSENTPTKTIG